ncbi:MAG: hypothetical protein SYR96_33985 [Actinomycetota bacterium]|nr:hypothetical protein [Actinomycetota bacterium]
MARARSASAPVPVGPGAGAVNGILIRLPFDDVARRIEAGLRRHGFVVAPALDVDRELLVRVGGHLRPYRILLVHCPATTLRILRSDPAAAALAVVLVTVRDTGDGIAVSASEPARPVVDGVRSVGDGLRRRIRAALEAEE